MWEIDILPEAEAELLALGRDEPAEQRAILLVIEKLEAVGPQLTDEHSRQVKGTKLRELRPRRGRSRYRAFYWRVGNVMRIGAIGPEAEHDRRGFRTAVNRAIDRLGAR